MADAIVPDGTHNAHLAQDVEELKKYWSWCERHGKLQGIDKDAMKQASELINQLKVRDEKVMLNEE